MSALQEGWALPGGGWQRGVASMKDPSLILQLEELNKVTWNTKIVLQYPEDVYNEETFQIKAYN